eukprot:13184588-Alexandrium_andersonii.AAC.1
MRWRLGDGVSTHWCLDTLTPRLRGAHALNLKCPGALASGCRCLGTLTTWTPGHWGVYVLRLPRPVAL